MITFVVSYNWILHNLSISQSCNRKSKFSIILLNDIYTIGLSILYTDALQHSVVKVSSTDINFPFNFEHWKENGRKRQCSRKSSLWLHIQLMFSYHNAWICFKRWDWGFIFGWKFFCWIKHFCCALHVWRYPDLIYVMKSRWYVFCNCNKEGRTIVKLRDTLQWKRYVP